MAAVGGAGGIGGIGGRGGDGAGGTVAIIGSVVTGTDGSINTLGGQSDNANPSNNGGRVVIGSNTVTNAPLVAGGPGSLRPDGTISGPFNSTVTLVKGPNDARSTIINTTGPTATNPFVVDAMTGQKFATPYIPNLVGGAEAFGLLNGVQSTDPFFAHAVSSAAPGATALLYRTHLGPAGYNFDFTGYDAVFLLNLTSDPLLDPELGVVENGTDESYLQALLSGGFADDPLFGGDGPTDLGPLGGFDVYEILVPELGTDVNFSVDGLFSSGPLEDGEVLSLGANGESTVPEPGTLAAFATGLFGLLGLRRVRARNSQFGRELVGRAPNAAN